MNQGMKRFIYSILSMIAIGSLSGCGYREKNITVDTKEIDINTTIKTPYKGDTLIGKFNGIDIDTLISEPIGTVTGFNYNWRVYTKNGTVKDLILENKTIDVRFIREGDLDGNGTEEWGFMHEWETSNWTFYDLYTFNNGEWQRMIEPLRIFKPHFAIYNRFGKDTYEDIIQKSNKGGFIKAKFSAIRNDNFVIVDTLIKVNPLFKKEKVQELTDYAEPFPIDVIKEGIYHNGGKESQKNISIKDLIREWEFERDIENTFKFNPDRLIQKREKGIL